MRRYRRIRSFLLAGLLALGWFIAAPLSAQAAPAPLVFDFEDGLQGWELQGSAQRVQTQLLGGEWAIFGDGSVPPLIFLELIGGNDLLSGTILSRRVDLTEISSISVERFLIDGHEDALFFILGHDIPGTIRGPNGRLRVIEPGNPSLRGVDVSSITGIRNVGFFWGFESGYEPPPTSVAFIDNITFHPVPEPSTQGLLASSFAALVIARGSCGLTRST